MQHLALSPGQPLPLQVLQGPQTQDRPGLRLRPRAQWPPTPGVRLRGEQAPKPQSTAGHTSGNTTTTCAHTPLSQEDKCPCRATLHTDPGATEESGRTASARLRAGLVRDTHLDTGTKGEATAKPIYLGEQFPLKADASRQETKGNAVLRSCPRPGGHKPAHVLRWALARGPGPGSLTFKNKDQPTNKQRPQTLRHRVTRPCSALSRCCHGGEGAPDPKGL